MEYGHSFPTRHADDDGHGGAAARRVRHCAAPRAASPPRSHVVTMYGSRGTRPQQQCMTPRPRGAGRGARRCTECAPPGRTRRDPPPCRALRCTTRTPSSRTRWTGTVSGPTQAGPGEEGTAATARSRTVHAGATGSKNKKKTAFRGFSQSALDIPTCHCIRRCFAKKHAVRRLEYAISWRITVNRGRFQ